MALMCVGYTVIHLVLTDYNCVVKYIIIKLRYINLITMFCLTIKEIFIKANLFQNFNNMLKDVTVKWY